MSKFNRAVTTAVASPVTAVPVAARTHEGGHAYERDPKSELFLLAASYMGGDGSFYEKAGDRENRLTSLARAVAADDPEWIAKLVPWLRNGAQMRTASVVVAAEAAKALIEAGKPGARQLIASGLQRSDEPGELIAYWRSRYGRQLPIAVKRGIADAVGRLYSEYAFLKHDSRDAALRFADVIEIVNPRYHLKEYGTWRDALWRYAIEDRHGRGNDVPEALGMVRASIALRKAAAGDPRALLDTAALKAAGFTWEDALSLAGSRVPKAELWTALIPAMGYMALLRNLRNFDQAGVPDDVAELVAKRLADPAQVARSRQLPFRFLSAYRAVPSLRWSWPLDKALTASLSNVPQLKGRTLVMVDTSTSMEGKFQGLDGTLARWDVAVLFGAAVALRCESADVVSFSGRSYTNESRMAKTRPFPLVGGESLLKALERWQKGGWFLGGGTDTDLALKASFSGHDRVVIVTDEQASDHGGEVSRAIPERVPLYTWNLAGEKYGHAPSGLGTRHTFGGLTDHAFRLIPMLEAARDARWDDLLGTPAA